MALWSKCILHVVPGECYIYSTLTETIIRIENAYTIKIFYPAISTFAVQIYHIEKFQLCVYSGSSYI